MRWLEEEIVMDGGNDEGGVGGGGRLMVGRAVRGERITRVPEYRYGVLLMLLVATFFFVGTAPSGRLTTLLTVIIESMTLAVALLASGARRIIIMLAGVVIALGVVVAVAQLFVKGHAIASATAGISALLVLVAPISIVRGLVARHTLDLKTVLGALCLYVMIGLFFAFTFNAIQTISGDPFFAQNHHGTAPDFVYFSFITLTTVGYGDLTALGHLGRSLAAFEAMLGQLYLVTVVALLVSNLGPVTMARRAKARGGEGG
jgi:hypothetical protein